MIGATTAVGFLGLLVLGMLILAGLVAGLVLLIIGLLRRQRAMWVTGLIVGTLCLLLLVGGLGLAIRLARQAASARFAAASTAAAPPFAAMTPQFMRVTGLSESFGYASYSMTRTGPVLCFDYGGLNRRDFRGILRSYFQPTTWEKMSKAIGSAGPLGGASWSDEELAGAAHYVRAHTDADGTHYVCYVAYDASAGSAFIFANEVEKPAEGTVSPMPAAAPAGDRKRERRP